MLKKQKYNYVYTSALFEIKCDECQKKIRTNGYFYNSPYYKNLCLKCADKILKIGG